METKTTSKIYLLIGGDHTNKWAEKLVKKWKYENKNGIFLVTGNPNKDHGELISMVELLIQNGVSRESIWITVLLFSKVLTT